MQILCAKLAWDICLTLMLVGDVESGFEAIYAEEHQRFTDPYRLVRIYLIEYLHRHLVPTG